MTLSQKIKSIFCGLFNLYLVMALMLSFPFAFCSIFDDYYRDMRALIISFILLVFIWKFFPNVKNPDEKSIFYVIFMTSLGILLIFLASFGPLILYSQYH